ncbi:hypothetical protein DWB77_01291 [Streptomyces hundungensis]|uniref:Uncharacterized protein n=1 Tax=Streptomyces hundungensis TaxID=1077946 RepID=A0A387H943_9ACTN|nr:hypothetical protein DWB77_01291 [Streptomyces hundungensis]
MSWDDVTLLMLAAFGAVMLLLTQITEVLSKLTDVIHAWREVRGALRERPAGSTEPRGFHGPTDNEPARGTAFPQGLSSRPTGHAHGGQEPGCERHGRHAACRSGSDQGSCPCWAFMVEVGGVGMPDWP